MTLFSTLRRRIRGAKVVDAAPKDGPLAELANKLAEQRGSNVTMNSGGGHDTTLAEFRKLADAAHGASNSKYMAENGS